VGTDIDPPIVKKYVELNKGFPEFDWLGLNLKSSARCPRDGHNFCHQAQWEDGTLFSVKDGPRAKSSYFGTCGTEYDLLAPVERLGNQRLIARFEYYGRIAKNPGARGGRGLCVP
jgi:hypothetical protein